MAEPKFTVKQCGKRQWQLGQFLVRVPDDAEDTEAEAWKAGYLAMLYGTTELAPTFHMAEYVWRIDGQQVHLRRHDAEGNPLPDTEEAARAVLEEARKEID